MRQITHKTLLAIYDDYKCSLSIKGAKGAVCLFIKQFLQQENIKSLVELGIPKKEVIKAIKTIKESKG